MERLNRIFKEASLRAVVFSRKSLGVNLDFSEESLKDLDNILDVFSRNKNIEDINKEKLIDVVMRFGGYLGEVISKNISGNWNETEEKEIFLRVNNKIVYPLNIVYKRIKIGERASIESWYNKFKNKF
ncbi:hypothetical protein ACED96_02475 [Clostridium thermobutyricum]|uniref:DUF3806 domain-containing protein n=1 Tax=Clostridium thermobutyricum DSM 4928 TaxID=1121339 RepID=A0A1V4SUR4_9CLOT|nr:hypothetical protein [Clostridium thermobutyricum]OPX47640.1 hypothetical protein CLTHE_17130 [Clostridium thermobutyricum DSM 4928]